MFEDHDNSMGDCDAHTHAWLLKLQDICDDAETAHSFERIPYVVQFYAEAFEILSNAITQIRESYRDAEVLYFLKEENAAAERADADRKEFDYA